ncbi:hypothetical protein ACFQ6N_01990 [Kitasatospora sp. NPDC056446]|uniref:hypothetical protein n=1 Tax=Kitasatospora sp. NPDC056446 TaxID=3345819 RepID=UPI0036B0A087
MTGPAAVTGTAATTAVMAATAVTAAGSADPALRAVELAFVLLLGGCAAGALALLGAWSRKGGGAGTAGDGRRRRWLV